jgi:hypothetical protein
VKQAGNLRNRSTREVLEDHLRKRSRGEFEPDLEQNYAAGVILLTCTGVYRGHAGLRKTHKILQESLPHADIECFNKLVKGEFAFVEWCATVDSVEVRQGVDSFVIRQGRICFQSIHYKLHSFDSN